MPMLATACAEGWPLGTGNDEIALVGGHSPPATAQRAEGTYMSKAQPVDVRDLAIVHRKFHGHGPGTIYRRDGRGVGCD